MFRRLCWTVLLALASIALTINVDAARADDAVGLSLDGRTWTAELRRPLFEAGFRWVPGDVETRSLWVRNQGPTAASMRIVLRTTDRAALLVNDDLQVDARVHDGAWTALADGSARALTDDVLAQGDRVRIDVRVSFDSDATNRTQLDRLPLRFVIRLTADAAGAGVDDGRDLPDTGSAVPLWLLWLAAGLIGSGLVLVAVRRRETPDE